MFIRPDDIPAKPAPLEIQVRPDYVACAFHFAEKKGVRHYLQGVYFEPCATGGVIVVATDGHALCVLHDPEGFASRPAIVGIRKGLVASIKTDAIKRRQSEDAPTLHIDSVRLSPWLNRITMTPAPKIDADNVIYHAAEIDHVFPEWRPIVRGIVPIEPASEHALPLVSTAVIRRVTKALDEIDAHFVPNLQYMFSGTNSPVIARSPVMGDGFFVLMPVRSDRVDADYLAWRGLPDFAAVAA